VRFGFYSANINESFSTEDSKDLVVKSICNSVGEQLGSAGTLKRLCMITFNDSFLAAPIVMLVCFACSLSYVA